MGEYTPDKTTYHGFREYWDAAPDSIMRQNILTVLRAWEAERKALERENLGLLDAAVKSAERVGALGRTAEAYKEAYLSERAFHANNTGENAARRKKAVVALREADDG
jgi:hypothetical protein